MQFVSEKHFKSDSEGNLIMLNHFINHVTDFRNIHGLLLGFWIVA